MFKYGVISGPYFLVFGLNTGKYGPEITPYLDTFHAVNETFLNGLDKLNARKVNTIKSSNIVCIFLFVSVKDKNSCSVHARLTSFKCT